MRSTLPFIPAMPSIAVCAHDVAIAGNARIIHSAQAKQYTRVLGSDGQCAIGIFTELTVVR